MSQQKDDSLPKPYSLQINVEKFSYKPIAVPSPPQMVLLQLIWQVTTHNLITQMFHWHNSGILATTTTIAQITSWIS